ncbi:MspA family porin [Gordonia sp. (in: high G+C Gram-positive bacteria)]|uniref:MspA family porin n=1 Tax=Gordonia sp. (in: high G+C Gram-positive bacteria) TaxID=84139 RepID=UPI0039E4D098
MATRFQAARRAAVVGVAAAAALLTVIPTAGADTFRRLPAGKARGEDGLTIIRSAESARVGPSLAANGMGRSAWVSGHVRVLAPNIDETAAGPNNGPRGEDAMPGSNGTSTTGAGGTTTVVYVVGCQVDISGLSLGGGTGIGNLGAAPLLGLNGALSLGLAPGQVKYAIIDRKQMTKRGTYYFNWHNSQMDIQGCGGYAQARSLAVVETTGNNHQKIQLWGRPFSIG